MSQLVLGAGPKPRRVLSASPDQVLDFEPDAVLVDLEPLPGYVCHDLDLMPWPFGDGQFTEVHAYNILEHLGRQGDWKAFFACFNEIGRVLAPGGLLFAVVPLVTGRWAWGDPGHSRVITREMLSFLVPGFYENGAQSAHYRSFLTVGWEIEWMDDLNDELFGFVLRRP